MAEITAYLEAKLRAAHEEFEMFLVELIGEHQDCSQDWVVHYDIDDGRPIFGVASPWPRGS